MPTTAVYATLQQPATDGFMAYAEHGGNQTDGVHQSPAAGGVGPEVFTLRTGSATDYVEPP